jgi:hypothetical protein
VPAAGTNDIQDVTARPIIAGAFRVLRRRFGLVAGPAVVVFGASAAIDVLVDFLADADVGSPGLLTAAALMASGLALFGTTFFAGLIDHVVAAEEHGTHVPTLRELLRTVPYGRLIAADLLLGLGAAALLLLLVVPGIIFFTFSCLVGPVVVMEDRKVRDAFRRSAQLVRGKFWLAFFLVTVPVAVEEDVVHSIVEAAHSLNPLLVFVINAAASAAVGSIVALVEVTLAHRLARRKPDPRRWQESNPPDGVRPSHSF